MRYVIALAMLCPFLYMCQPITVKGRVINEEGEPVAGATVTVRCTMNLERPVLSPEVHTISDGNGEFLIPDRFPSDTLIVTAAGYETAHETFNIRGVVTVILKRKRNPV